MLINEELERLKNALFDFSKRNNFLHTNPSKLWVLNEDVNENLPEKLAQKARFYSNEYAIETSLKVSAFIQWIPPKNTGKNQDEPFLSPLFYQPCRIRKNQKISTAFSIDVQSELFYSNPALKHYFQIFYNYELPATFENLDDAIARIVSFFNTNEENDQITLSHDFTPDGKWAIIQREAVGIFNYKKSALGSDYDDILSHPNDSIKDLLLGDDNQPAEKPVDYLAIDNFDQSQAAVISRAMDSNLVIQGPPGTGKSHTIVGLIGAYMANNKKVLFVSEKRSALEVVANRIKEKKMSELIAYFSTDKDQKKQFYSRLKKSVEQLIQPKKQPTSNSRQPYDSLFNQLYPSKIKGEIAEYLEILLTSGFQPSELHTSIPLPDFAEWKKQLAFITNFEEKTLPEFDAKYYHDAPFSQLNPVVFSENNVVLTLEKRLNDLSDTVTKIKGIIQEFDLNISFERLVKLALTASILEMVNKVQLDLLNKESKPYAAFDRWAKKYQLLKSKLQQAEIANQGWTKKPSLSEIIELLDLLKRSEHQPSKSIFSVLRRNPAKLKTAFSDFHPAITVHSKIKLLESVQLEWRLRDELEAVKIKLKHNLKIEHPEHEIDLIFSLRQKLDAVSKNEYLFILEHEQHQSLIVSLSNLHPDLVKFNSQRRFIFQENEIENFETFELVLAQLKKTLPRINHWLPELKEFFKLPQLVRSACIDQPLSIHRITATIAYHNLLKATRFEPNYKTLSGWSLLKDYKSAIQHEKHDYKSSVNTLLLARENEFNSKQTLIETPAFKLSDAQKLKKKQFKSARRMLMHEMNKQQRHMPVRHFFEACQDWLLTIHPVWMMNPLSVAENFPNESELFDVVIFDESSQIPLEDAIPAIYRSKQVIIVGDSNQMPPSAFFTSKTETETLLDKAETVYQKAMLKWHYRSKHPGLIQFSNQQFYDDQLITLPASIAEKPIEIIQCNGTFDQGVNHIEAENIAKYCKHNLSNAEKSVLIIAFSKEQEKMIRRLLEKGKIHQLEKIQLTNLENVQGVEADIVLISIGYAPNQDGEFRMNFGPVNQFKGANRLNVLFTRAIEKMILFRSITSNDFKLSENQGVNVLKNFMHYSEDYELSTYQTPALSPAQQWIKTTLNESNLRYEYVPAGVGSPIGYFIDLNRKKILLVNPGLNNDEVIDVSSFIKTLIRNFESVKIVLSADIWLNEDRIKNELHDYFL